MKQLEAVTSRLRCLWDLPCFQREVYLLNPSILLQAYFFKTSGKILGKVQ
jgi:hypothetical protein